MSAMRDTIMRRAARVRAYRAGAYSFTPPPVQTTRWRAQSWHNVVRFTPASLTGVLPLDDARHARAAAIVALGDLARGRYHPGYVWAAVCDDSALLCAACVRSNYALILRATRDADRSGWQTTCVVNASESEELEECAHCGRVLNEGTDHAH